MTMAVRQRGTRIGAVLGLAMGGALALSGAARAEGPELVVVDMHPKLTRAAVDAAVTAVDAMATDAIAKGMVPGLAIAVVYQGETVFSAGYGLREMGTDLAVDADTVFQLASVSKPLGSTVIAALIGEGKIDWDSRIADLDPKFALITPWVTSQLTIRDLYAHRSGLPDHAGDLLEDYGFKRDAVLHRLRYVTPKTSFRSGYAYTNFGLTEAALAAAGAYGLSWEDASEKYLYGPLGMTATSSRFDDFWAHENKALGHVKVDGQWVHKVQRQPDAQSPAGGASSSVNDMAKWIGLILAKGEWDGKPLIPADPLQEAHLPVMLTEPRTPFGYPGFYGLGWNVGFTADGRNRLSHSGAFALGGATTISLFPDDGLGIVVLTNAAPFGLPEALASTFSDTAFYGKPLEDWLPLFGAIFAQAEEAEAGPDFATPPDDPYPAAPRDSYIGSYANDYFGTVEIVAEGDGLAMVVGPENLSFPLTHYDRDIFTWETIGEFAIGLSSVTFALDKDRKASGLVVGQWEAQGVAPFKRQ